MQTYTFNGAKMQSYLKAIEQFRARWADIVCGYLGTPGGYDLEAMREDLNAAEVVETGEGWRYIACDAATLRGIAARHARSGAVAVELYGRENGPMLAYLTYTPDMGNDEIADELRWIYKGWSYARIRREGEEPETVERARGER